MADACSTDRETFAGTPFERALIAACAADESVLRRELAAELRGAGFELFFDEYRASSRRDDAARELPNLLAVRGAPRVCLVAHTDLVRDHRGYAEDRGRVEPVVRRDPATGRRIVTDRTNATQVGGDDRVGVAIARMLALESRRPLAILLTTDEEIGLQGAAAVPNDWLERFELLVQSDRGSRFGRELVTQIGGTRLCSAEREARLLAIAEALGSTRAPVVGGSTDVAEFKARGMRADAVNLTCGYYAPHSVDEWIDVEEAEEAARYVRAILDSEAAPVAVSDAAAEAPPAPADGWGGDGLRGARVSVPFERRPEGGLSAARYGSKPRTGAGSAGRSVGACPVLLPSTVSRSEEPFMPNHPPPNPNFDRIRSDASAMLALPELFAPSDIDVEIHGKDAADALFREGLRQLKAGRGATEENPLAGLGVEGFYVLARACDLQVTMQSAVFRDDGRILDCMELEGEDVEGRYEAVLFNLVERGA